MSQGFLSEPPNNRSGAIQFRLPRILTAPAAIVLLVTSDLIRERPKSQSTALWLSSIRTFIWMEKKISNKSEISQDVGLHNCFKVTVNNLF
jgi:hypothetical protein